MTYVNRVFNRSCEAMPELPAKEAGLEWMNGRAADLAVPPAYTEYIGAQLMRVLEQAA